MATREQLFDYARFGAALEREKELRGLGRWKDVADEAGVSPSKLSYLLAGRGLSLDNLFLLCDWLGCRVDDYRRRP